MGIEIERKFLVERDDWRRTVDRARRLRQGYFRTGPESTVRPRLIEPVEAASDGADADRRGILTIKGRPSDGVRPEFEYTIPPGDVEQMLALFCGDRQITKVRHQLRYAGRTWVVDAFEGANDGLVMAEVELDDPEADVELPDWIGREVTDDPDYTNAALAREPISERS